MPARLIRHSLTLFTLSGSILLLLNCRATENNSGGANALNSTVKAKLKEPYEISYNKSQTYALCQQARTADHMERRFNFIVVRLSDNKIIVEGSFRMGYVQWIDDDSIEVLNSSSPAVRDDEKGEKKIIDIHSSQL